MKKILKNIAISILISIAVIPAILLQIYYLGGENYYYLEISNIKNLENLIIFMIILGAWLGFCLTLFVNTVINGEKSESSIKKATLVFVVKIIFILALVCLGFLIPELFHLFSETMVGIIQLNICIIFIILMMANIIRESSEIRKINKKLKEIHKK